MNYELYVVIVHDYLVFVSLVDGDYGDCFTLSKYHFPGVNSFNMQLLRKVSRAYATSNLRRNYKVVMAIIAFAVILYYTLFKLHTTDTKLLPRYQTDKVIASTTHKTPAIATIEPTRSSSTRAYGIENMFMISNSTLNDDQDLIRLQSNEEMIKWIGDQFIVKYDLALSIKKCKIPPLILLAINSAAGHFDRRHGIRQTWGNPKYFKKRFDSDNIWKVIFIVGSTGNNAIDNRVDREAQTHGDLLIIGQKEHHKILTDKTLLGMYWASQICQAKFYFKGDDDVWVNKWKLFDLIVQLSVQINSNIDTDTCWIGYVSKINHVPIRDRSSKYYVSRDDFAGDRFPQFCSGFSYVMSKETASRIILSIPHIKKIPGIDDVYIGLLANDSGIHPTHDVAFRIRTYDASRSVYTEQMLYETIAEHGVLDSKLMIKFQKMAKSKYLSLFKND